MISPFLLSKSFALSKPPPNGVVALLLSRLLPGNQRLCRYALKGDISFRLCTRLYQCAACEFGQIMQDEMERKQTKLAARREALRKKEEKVRA